MSEKLPDTPFFNSKENRQKQRERAILDQGSYENNLFFRFKKSSSDALVGSEPTKGA